MVWPITKSGTGGTHLYFVGSLDGALPFVFAVGLKGLYPYVVEILRLRATSSSKEPDALQWFNTKRDTFPLQIHVTTVIKMKTHNTSNKSKRLWL